MAWAQYILGACEPLQYSYNWYEAGEMTVDEAADAFNQIVQDAPYNLRTCPNPAGGKIFRINASGHTEEYNDAGEWSDPSGDATIPPVPARTEGSPDDQKCLAAKNAANVLQLLYENLTDSFNEGLDEAEAATALTLTLVALIGSEFAPITFALVTFFSIVFSVLYGVLEFVGADLWDETFTKTLYCILLECATNDAGVVTFDWDCFQNALAAQTNVFDLTFEQLRLFGQIEYLLLVIGGVDALNTAGATTAITDDTCDCDPGWCYHQDGTNTLSEWVAETVGVATPTYSSDLWHSSVNGDTAWIWISWTMASTTQFTDASVLGYTPTGRGRAIYANGDGTPFSGVLLWQNGFTVGTPYPLNVDRLDVYLVDAHDATDGTIGIMQFSGNGTCPFGDPNC